MSKIEAILEHMEYDDICDLIEVIEYELDNRLDELSRGTLQSYQDKAKIDHRRTTRKLDGAAARFNNKYPPASGILPPPDENKKFDDLWDKNVRREGNRGRGLLRAKRALIKKNNVG